MKKLLIKWLPRNIRDSLSISLFRIRGLFFKLEEHLFGYQKQRKNFIKNLGYELNLKNPRSFNEKIVWKKIYDRNPLLVQTSDKFRVRDYVIQTLGRETAKEILIPLLYVTDNPSTIPFKSLPKNYIIKVTHDSGGYEIIKDGEKIETEEIIAKFKKLLKIPYGILKHEWAYQKIIKRQIIIEQLLKDKNGNAQDYKFHIFHGQCKFIHTTPKIGIERRGVRSLFTPQWKLLPVSWKHPAGPHINPPIRLREMITIAEKLASPFDYVRVDLYEIDGRVYFGELTHYHGSGREKFKPRSFDFKAGSWWNIKPNYWIHKN